MLPAFIIEELKKREREKEQQRQLELPLYPYVPPSQEPTVKEEQRGVIIVEMGS